MTGDAPDLGSVSIGGDGHVLAANGLLAQWQLLAGGGETGPLVLGAAAKLVHDCRRLNMPLSRAVRLHVAGDDWLCWIDAHPAADAVMLRLTRANKLDAAAPLAAKDRLTEAHSAADCSIWIDSGLRILRIAGAKSYRLSAWIGEPLLGQISFAAGSAEQARVIERLSERQPIAEALVTVAGEANSPYAMRGHPLIDQQGRFAGYRLDLYEDQQPSDAALPVDGATALKPPTPPRERIFGTQLVPALRQPLDRIIANAETISARLQGPLRSEYASYASDIADAGRHLLSLVEDLSDLEVIENPQFRASGDAIDLVDLAHRAAGLLAVKAADTMIKVQLMPRSESVPATGEFRRVLQILVNLIGNALNYSPAGSVISIAAGRDEAMAWVSVTDEGAGIPEEAQAKIFNKFERLGRSGDGGTGLGLYISRRLALAMRGQLTVANAAEKGACFTLSLPARED